MHTLITVTLVCAFFVYVPTEYHPEATDYEQAKMDCAHFGGLVRLEGRAYLFGETYTDATCVKAKVRRAK